MTPDPIYTEKIGFMSKPKLKEVLEEYAKEEGVKPAVICRKAIYSFLKEKGTQINKKDCL